MRGVIVTAMAVLAFASTAFADTAYIEPSTFTPEIEQTITIEAAFNDDCCVPKYAVRSDVYGIVLPNGDVISPDRIENFATSTVIEHTITAAGTTRITTGERLGRKGGEYVWLDGQYYLINSDDADPIDVPVGTVILTSQTETVSDTYVTVGEPTWESIKQPIGRLIIAPSQHPSTLKAGDVFVLDLEFDGKPLANQEIVLTHSGQKERAGDEGVTYHSNQDGRVSIPLSNIGTHVVMTRFQAKAPADAETDIRSYTTALTFLVSAD